MDSDKEIKALFRKYLSGSLQPQEAAHFRRLVTDMDESWLDVHLNELWDSYIPDQRRNKKNYKRILGNLNRMFHAQRRLIPFLYRAAVVLVPILFLSIAYLYMDKKQYKEVLQQEYTVRADNGERASLTLPDGTRVFLNSHSVLSYTNSFALNERGVTLAGEAYFEVAKDAKKPFVVYTPDVQVRVLGTVFNLSAYPGDNWVEVTLLEGSVEVIPTHEKTNKILLHPGRKACYNSLIGEMYVDHTDFRLETAWRKGDLLFRSEQLSSIIRKLEKFYGVQIHVEGNLPENAFTGSFHEEDINMVLINLQTHYDFAYTKSGQKIAVKFKD